MAFSFDPISRRISMPPGDTAQISVRINWGALAPGDVVLFAINDAGQDIFVKRAEIVDGLARIRLCNHDTRDLQPGLYRWQLRVVTDPELDDEGNVRAEDCSDNVISVFSGGQLPVFKLEGGAARV